MSLPKRKLLRYKNYDYKSNGYYFITICVKDRQKILSDIIYDNTGNRAAVHLSGIGKIVEHYILNIAELYKDISIENYVIMPDHIHMFIGISNWDNENMRVISENESEERRTDVSHIVRTLKILVTKEIGYSIWQKSFFDVIVTNPKWFDNVDEYIDNNPQRWCENKYGIAPPISLWKK